MRNRIIAVCLLLTIVLPSTVLASYKGLPSNATHRTRIALRSCDISKLEGKSSDEIDKILYPSGMQLPTKYLDFAMFYNFSDYIEVSGATYTFLTNNWPNETATYTYPEVLAAQMFLYLWYAQNFAGSDFVCADTINTWIEDCIGDIEHPKCTTYITDTSILFKVLDSYKVSYETLSFHKAYLDDTVPLSRGRLFAWDTYVIDGYTAVSQQECAQFWSTRQEYMSKLSIAIMYVEDTTASFDCLYPSEGGNELSEGGAFAGMGTDDKDTSVVTPPSPSVDEEEPVEVPPAALVGDNYVNTVPVVGGGVGEVEREVDWRNMYTIACLVVAAIFVAVGVVVDYVNKRKDPLRNYKRW